MPSSRNGIGGPLSHERRPAIVPYIKGGCKINLVPLRETRGNPLQLDASLEPRVVCQIAGDDLFLVEVAHLDGDVGEELSYAGPAVEDDRLDLASKVFQRPASLPVRFNRLRPDLPDIDVLLQVGCPHDEDAEAPPEEGDIEDENDGHGIMALLPCRCAAYALPDNWSIVWQ